MLRLLAPTLNKFFARDPFWKSKVILNLMFPQSERVARVDQDRIPQRSPKVNGSRKPSETAANNNDFPGAFCACGFVKFGGILPRNFSVLLFRHARSLARTRRRLTRAAG